MNNYERLYGDVYFYSMEYERACKILADLKSRGEGDAALTRAEREVKKIKAKLDALCEMLPEEVSEGRRK